jgi:hypothetical protein
MKYEAFPAGLASPRARSGLGHSETIGAMSAAWDDMAAGLLAAIRTGDFTAYDTAMTKFRSHLRDGREPITPVRVNNGK